MFGNFAEVPDDAEPGEEFQGVVGDVDFPPEKALACGGHEMVMIVVPAFAESDEGQQEIVAAGIGGLVAACAKKVRERINREGAVPDKHRAQAESPNE